MPTLKIDPASDLHRAILARIISRMSMARSLQVKRWINWMDAENRMICYMPEQLMDSKRRLRRENNGEPLYTTIQIPYTYAIVMTAHTYWTSVFFGRNPVHQFMGRNGTGEMQVQAMEALIQYQIDVGRCLAPYYMWLYDAAKYGQGIIGTWWDRSSVQYGSIEPDPETGELVQVSRQLPGYQGNRVYNISPYDFFHDPRVTLGNFQRGEFCAVEIPMAWHELKKGEARGDYMNVDMIRAHSGEWRGQGDRENASSQVIRPDDTIWTLDTGELKHPSRIRLLEFHVELAPKEWGVGNASSTEKWVFTITGDERLIVGARPLGAIHGEFPFGVIEPELEAYGVYNRGLPELVDPLQRTMDWLINTHFYNVRASLNNQFVVDPSRVVMRDIQKGGPGFVFRTKPEAYGQDVRTMINQLPVSDVTRGHMTDVDALWGMSGRFTGVTEQLFGQIQQGGRKTATEVRTGAGFGTNRQKTQTEWISVSAFNPHAIQLVKNTQQFYDSEQKVRIVGDAADYAGPQFIDVTPDTITGEYDVVPVDGTMPVDRMAQMNTWTQFMQSVGGQPELMQGYDMNKLIGWIFTLGGLKNVGQFRVKVMPPGAQPDQSQGNVIPFAPGGRSPPSAGPMGAGPQAAGLNTLGGVVPGA